MRKMHRETQEPHLPSHGEAGEKECPACGNLKLQRTCVVCRTEMERLDYQANLSVERKAPKISPAPSAEVPKTTTGKRLDGSPGSDEWEERKRKILGNEKTA